MNTAHPISLVSFASSIAVVDVGKRSPVSENKSAAVVSDGVDELPRDTDFSSLDNDNDDEKREGSLFAPTLLRTNVTFSFTSSALSPSTGCNSSRCTA